MYIAVHSREVCGSDVRIPPTLDWKSFGSSSYVPGRALPQKPLASGLVITGHTFPRSQGWLPFKKTFALHPSDIREYRSTGVEFIFQEGAVEIVPTRWQSGSLCASDKVGR